MFHLEDYNYHLPEELIAQVPATIRDRARLLVLDRSRGVLSDHRFLDLPRLLRRGDLLVANNTKVVPARLSGRKESGGRVEILVLEHPNGDASRNATRWCLLKSSKRPQKGAYLSFNSQVSARVEKIGDGGLAQITFSGIPSVDDLLEREGHVPLPPYIKRGRNDRRSSMDRQRYQTIFAKERGAVAAPTAGLHFTEGLMRELAEVGVLMTDLTLHVGHGTFRPVRSEDIRDHKLGEETYVISPSTAEAVNRAKRAGRRVIAVGTTVVRALEAAAGGQNGEISPGKGRTELLITPGFPFRVVDVIITNFHLPKSSLLFLVSAFASLDLIREAYRWAVEKQYRFYSYGDAMLIT